MVGKATAACNWKWTSGFTRASLKDISLHVSIKNIFLEISTVSWETSFNVGHATRFGRLAAFTEHIARTSRGRCMFIIITITQEDRRRRCKKRMQLWKFGVCLIFILLFFPFLGTTFTFKHVAQCVDFKTYLSLPSSCQTARPARSSE